MHAPPQTSIQLPKDVFALIKKKIFDATRKLFDIDEPSRKILEAQKDLLEARIILAQI